MSAEYRINVRFNQKNNEHLKILEFFSSQGRKFSRNRFIIDAIAEKIGIIENQNRQDEDFERFRQIIREEISNAKLTVVSSDSDKALLSDKERQQNDDLALDALDMFG